MRRARWAICHQALATNADTFGNDNHGRRVSPTTEITTSHSVNDMPLTLAGLFGGSGAYLGAGVPHANRGNSPLATSACDA